SLWSLSAGLDTTGSTEGTDGGVKDGAGELASSRNASSRNAWGAGSRTVERRRGGSEAIVSGAAELAICAGGASCGPAAAGGGTSAGGSAGASRPAIGASGGSAAAIGAPRSRSSTALASSGSGGISAAKLSPSRPRRLRRPPRRPRRRRRRSPSPCASPCASSGLSAPLPSPASCAWPDRARSCSAGAGAKSAASPGGDSSRSRGNASRPSPPAPLAALARLACGLLARVLRLFPLGAHSGVFRLSLLLVVVPFVLLLLDRNGGRRLQCQRLRLLQAVHLLALLDDEGQLPAQG